MSLGALATIVVLVAGLVAITGCSTPTAPPAKAPDPFAGTEVDGTVPLVAPDDPPPPSRPRLSRSVSLGAIDPAAVGQAPGSEPGAPQAMGFAPAPAGPRRFGEQRAWTKPDLFAEDGNPYAAGVRTGVRPTFRLRSHTTSSAR